MSFFATYMLSCEIQNDKIGPCQSKSVFTAFGLWEKIKSASYAVLCFVSSQLAVSASWEWCLQSREQTIFIFFFFPGIFWLKEKSLGSPLDSKKKHSRNVIWVGGS